MKTGDGPFSTPQINRLMTPQKKSALNALEMLSKEPPIFPIQQHSDTMRYNNSNVSVSSTTMLMEEPSPARLEGASALVSLFNPSTPGISQSLMSMMSEAAEGFDKKQNNNNKKNKNKRKASSNSNLMKTPSVPKVRRYSTSKKQLALVNAKNASGNKNSTRKTPKTVNVSNRKEKALGLLCLRFVQEFEKRGNSNGDVFLDEAGNKLGVERRRIYDIVNILEALDIVSRKAKNLYTWHGIDTLPKTIATFEKRFKSDWNKLSVNDKKKIFIGSRPISKYKTLRENGSSREKSLAVLTQQFILLFLQDLTVAEELMKKKKISKSAGNDSGSSSSKQNNSNIASYAALVTSLDSAAGRLRRGPEDHSQMKTKVRRLYDIANVLCTLDIIHKVQLMSKRKPVFAWKGTTSVAYTNTKIGVDGLNAPIAISEKTLLLLRNSTSNLAYETPCLVVDTSVNRNSSSSSSSSSKRSSTTTKQNARKKNQIEKKKKRKKEKKANASVSISKSASTTKKSKTTIKLKKKSTKNDIVVDEKITKMNNTVVQTDGVVYI